MNNEKIIEAFCKSEKVSDKEKHEFGLWCASQVRHLMEDPRSIAALDAKRKWLDGEISDGDLDAAWDAAWAAAWDAVDAARAAARAAADSAWAEDAAWAAAWAADSARDASRAAALAADADAARDAARDATDAAREKQAKWIKENTNFEVES